MAEEQLAGQTALRGKVALVQLQQQRVRNMSIKRGLQSVLGESPDKQQQAKATQLQLLVDAEGVCSSAQAQAATGATDGPMLAVLTALQAGFASLKRLIEGPSDDKNELKAVVSALISEAPSLANPGWTGQGHWYECADGHPYIITECGGATQASICPECGEPIGGNNHRLTAGNRESTVLRGLAAQAARQQP